MLQHASSSPAGVSYIPGIDGLRAVAVLAVVLYHLDAALVPGGFAGVDVFFAISGYVVSSSLVNHGGRGLGDFLLTFYARRIARIMPALVVCLVITSALSVLFIPQSWLSQSIPHTGLYAFFGLANYALVNAGDGYYAARAESNPFTHTWSLAVEEQFYLVYPLVFFVWLSYRNRGGALGTLARSLLAILVGLSLVVAWHQTKHNPNAAFYLLYSRFWELALGGLLYQLHHRGVLLPRGGAATTACLLAGLALILASFALATAASFPFPMALMPVTGSLLVIAAAVGQAQARARSVSRVVLENPLALYVGKISYSLYLWHWPVLVLLRWTIGLDTAVSIAAAVGLSAAASMASYHLVEMPVRRSAWVRSGRRVPVLVAGLGTVALGAWVGATLFAHQNTLSLSVTRDVETWYPSAFPTSNANFGALSGTTMFVVGDSHAVAYATMLRLLQDIDGLTVRTIDKAGCAVAPLLHPGIERCAAFVESALAEVEATARPGDIVFLPGLRVPRLVDGPLDDARILAIVDHRAAPAAWLAALEEAHRIVTRLETRSLRVIFEAQKPLFKALPYRCADWFNAMNPACARGFSIEREFIEAYRRPITESLQALAARHPSMRVWDPLPALCPGSRCSAFDEGRPLYFDSDHLSAHGNRVAYRSFQPFLLEMLPLDGARYRTVEMSARQQPGLTSTGLSFAEPWGRWTDGPAATLRFTDRLPARFRLVLRLEGSFGPNAGEPVEVAVGTQRRRFTAPAAAASVALDFDDVPPGTDTLAMTVPRPTSPSELGLSADRRRLGLRIVSLEIAPPAP
jgi:peptidoglycan/LPS O-acetylase OafA/YrhL